jgi:glycerol-3-phosphate dehydrogenase
MNADSACDVAIIGAGVVGTALAREFSRHELRCVLVEAGADVGAGTSKANTALLHTGFDAKPGTLEAQLVRRGHELLSDYAPRAGIPLERVGAILVAWSEEQYERFPAIIQQANQNGYAAIREISSVELYAREPNLGPGARGALEVPDEAIICPFTTPLAFATEAVSWGCELRLNSPVTGLVRDGAEWVMQVPQGKIRSPWLINAAGLRSDEIDAMTGHARFTVTPRRGELIVFDKLAGDHVDHIILAVPTATSKGVLVSPTVFGNVMVGPTAVDIDRKDDTSSTADGLEYVLRETAKIVPRLTDHEVTAVYVGLRAATEHPDYQLSIDPELGYVCVGGIRSTGLSASLAIAEYVREHLSAAGLRLDPKTDLQPVRMPNIGERFPRPYADAEAIADDPAYGEIVCFCERVTRGEIRDALHAVIPATDGDSLRRRTRAQMGRCQGFYCHARVSELISEAVRP